MANNKSDLDFDIFKRSDLNLTKSNSVQPILTLNHNLPKDKVINSIDLSFHKYNIFV